MRYNWQHPNWPGFEYDLLAIQPLLYQYAQESSALLGGFSHIPLEIQSDAMIDLMVSEALNTSEIEGVKFNAEDLRSSLKKALGLPTLTTIKNVKTIGISELMIAVRQTFLEPLTEQDLFHWHEMVMSHLGLEQYYIPDIGRFRSDPEPMQIISGSYGHEKVHFEAPPSAVVPNEMARFIDWFNATDPKKTQEKIPGPIRAAIAHLYFESIHPFSDGNGRIGRAIAEKALSQDLGHPVLLSLSGTIQSHKKEYYAALSEASRDNLNITPWIQYFVTTVYEAQLTAKKQIQFVFQKTKFWDQYRHTLNKRQEKALARMFEAGLTGFEGGINTRKYMIITDCSKATATRDLSELLKMGCLASLPGSGRSTAYALSLKETNKHL